MVSNNLILYSGKILAEAARDILYFPLWWYTRGLLELMEKLIQFMIDREKSIGLFVWMKNIFRPMYGQTDWQGYLISVLMRIVQIIFRSIAMIFWLIAAFFVFVIWNVLPIFIIYQILFQLNA